MNVAGPIILTVGQGEFEEKMLKALAASGFNGNVVSSVIWKMKM